MTTFPTTDRRIPIRKERPLAAQDPLAEVSKIREMPHSPDAERAVLGAILIRNNCYWRVENLSTDDFYKPAHVIIFTAMVDMAEERREIELLTLKEELVQRSQLEQAGGVAYISSLIDVVPDIANVERYAKTLRRYSKRRKCIAVGNRLVMDALDSSNEPEECIAKALTDLSDDATKADDRARPLHEVIHEAFQLQERRLTGDAAGFLTTGFQGLDFAKAIRRTLVVLSCPSKHGKTSMAINIADALSEHKHTSCLFTLESTEYESAMRYVSKNSGVPHGRVQDWTLLRDGELARMLEAEKYARDKPFLVTRRIRTVEGIRRECMRLKSMGPLDAAAIDYVQILRTEERFENREARMAHICEMLLEMSIDLEILVLITSQVNKDRLTRESGRLYMEDLKYGAVIGETARVGILFQRPYMVEKDPSICPSIVNLQIEANNENVTNDLPFYFDEATQRFSEGTCRDNNCRCLKKEEPPQRRLL